jgi:hypothetical protein
MILPVATELKCRFGSNSCSLAAHDISVIGAGACVRTESLAHMLQVLNDDADVQQLKQRRQNLMYQVAVLQLQRVSAAATPPAQAP